MDDVLDSQEKDGLRPLKLKRLRRSDRLTLLLLWPPPMLVCESDMATRPSSPSMLASSALQPGGGVGGGLPAAAKVWIRSSGVIGGSDIVPILRNGQSIRHPSIKIFCFYSCYIQLLLDWHRWKQMKRNDSSKHLNSLSRLVFFWSYRNWFVCIWCEPLEEWRNRKLAWRRAGNRTWWSTGRPNRTAKTSSPKNKRDVTLRSRTCWFIFRWNVTHY